MNKFWALLFLSVPVLGVRSFARVNASMAAVTPAIPAPTTSRGWGVGSLMQISSRSP